jgi:hypothetical protein
MYYELSTDMTILGRWYVGSATSDIVPLSRYAFCSCAYVNVDRVHVPLSQGGTPLDFAQNAFTMPVVSRKVREVLEHACGDHVQLVEAEIEGYGVEYSVLNVLTCLDCIDEGRSEFKRTGAVPGPQSTSRYFMMTKLVLDPVRAGDVPIFRPKGWQIVIIVHQDVRDALVGIQASGIHFAPVEA